MASSADNDGVPTRFAFIPPPQSSAEDNQPKPSKRSHSKTPRRLIIEPGELRGKERQRWERPLHPSSNKREGVDHKNPPPAPSGAPVWTNEIRKKRDRNPPEAPYTRASMGIRRGILKDEILREEGARGDKHEEASNMNISATRLANFQRDQEKKKMRGEQGHATRWEHVRGSGEEDKPREEGSKNTMRRPERHKRDETILSIQSVAKIEPRQNINGNENDQQDLKTEQTRAKSFAENGSMESSVPRIFEESKKRRNMQRSQSLAQRALSIAVKTVGSMKEKPGSALATHIETFENSKAGRNERESSREEHKIHKPKIGPERSMQAATMRRSTTGSLGTAKEAQSVMLEKVRTEAADRLLAASIQAEEADAEELEERSRKTAERLAIAEEVNSLKRSKAFGLLPQRTTSLPNGASNRAPARTSILSGIQRRQTVNAIAREGRLEGTVTSVEKAAGLGSKANSQTQSNRTGPETSNSTSGNTADLRPNNKSQNLSKASKSQRITHTPYEETKIDSQMSAASKLKVQSAPAQAPLAANALGGLINSSQTKKLSNTNVSKTIGHEKLLRVEEEYLSEGEALADTILGRGFGNGRRSEMQGVRLKSEIQQAEDTASRRSEVESRAKTELHRGMGDGRRSEMQGVRLKSEVESEQKITNNPNESLISVGTILNRTGFRQGARSVFEGLRLKSEVERETVNTRRSGR